MIPSEKHPTIPDRIQERWFVEVHSIGMETTPWWSVYQAESLADGLAYLRRIRAASVGDPPGLHALYRLRDRASHRIIL